jgi:hypothetical protein
VIYLIVQWDIRSIILTRTECSTSELIIGVFDHVCSSRYTSTTSEGRPAAMALLAAFSLKALHIFYSLALLVYSGWKRLTGASPQPLEATRRRIPKHLAVIIAVDPKSSCEDVEKSLIGTIVNVVAWCRIIGTQKLTVYEEHGMCHC